MIEMAVREHDVSDIRPRRPYASDRLADRLASAGRTCVDEHDAT